MFNFRRAENWPRFSAEPSEELPEFRIGNDGAPLPAPTPRPMSLAFRRDLGASVAPAMSDLLLQTGGPVEPSAMTGLQDRFAGNPYWSGGRDRSNPIMPAGYGSPVAPAQRPLGEMIQTPPRHPDPQLDVGAQDLPDVTAPNAGAGTNSPQSPILVQYKPGGTPPPTLPSRPQVDDSPGEVVVLPDGSTIADAKSPTGHVMSPKADLHEVAARGRQIGETYRAMLANPGSGAGALLYLYSALGLGAGQGGTYDHQRSGNMITGYTQLPQFRPIANVNVGLLAQQAGLTLEETLGIAGMYARLRSSNADANGLYGLDHRTLHYITRGHEIGRAGMFDPPGPR
jgi:hypothetical protein